MKAVETVQLCVFTDALCFCKWHI